MQLISKTSIPALLYLLCPIILQISSYNIYNNDSLYKPYYKKYLYSYKQDIHENIKYTYIVIIISIIAGLFYIRYIYMTQNNIILFLSIIFVILYTVEYSCSMTTLNITHQIMFLILCTYALLYFTHLMLTKKIFILKQ